MSELKKTIEVKVERTISASPGAVFNGWLNPKVPGNPWNAGEKLLFHPEVDGLFHLSIQKNAHYGRFTQMERPDCIQHTWVSPSTSGLESVVTVTFKKQGEGTLVTLLHTGLPDTDGGKSHDKGWNYFLDLFPKQFGDGPR